MGLPDADGISSSKLYRIKLYRLGDEPEIVVIVGTNCISEYNSKYNTEQIVFVRAGFNSVGPIGPCAYGSPHWSYLYSRLFKYTQQHTPCFTENSNDYNFFMGPTPPTGGTVFCSLEHYEIQF